MNRSILSALLAAGALLIASAPPARAQDAGPVLIKEVVTREYSVHVGGVQTPDPKELVSREASLFIENGPANPYAQVLSREVSLGVGSAAAPPPITDLSFEVSPTGETVTLDWGGYNQWSVGDIQRFDIYVSDEGPITDLAGRTPVAAAPGGSTSFTLTGLAAYRDHYFVVVPVDLLGHADPALTYSAAYVLAPQVVSREVSLFVGGEPTPPYRQVLSREASLLVVSAAAPAPITDLRVTTSPTGDSATLDWSGYNPWAVSDVAHFAVYASDTGPITRLADATLIRLVSAEALAVTIDGLTPFTEHYFAVVPVDGQGHYDPAVHYAAGYVMSPQIVSREVSLFVGGEPDPPYAQAVSREVSLLVPGATVPAPVTGLDSGFSVETARDAYSAVDLDWSGYNETAQQDVVSYRIYVGPGFFETVTGLEPFATVPAGTQRYTLNGLPGGAILHFAVVAEDALGNFNPAVRSFSAKASIAGVEEVLGLAVTSAADSLSYSWQPPAGAGGFLASYRLYFAGAVQPLVLPAGATAWQATGLAAATGYPLRLATVDVFGKESPGTARFAATLLSNPARLWFTALGPRLILNWEPVAPAALVSHYAIYSAAAPITQVDGLAPLATETGTSLTLGTYDQVRDRYFAVATVNVSDGTDPRVSSVLAEDVRDRSPPTITEVRFGTLAVADGVTLTRPDRLRALAADPAGVARVEFGLDGVPFASLVSATNDYATQWDIAAATDGAHRLGVTAYDTYGNAGTLSYAVQIALAPPPAPRITSPADGFSTNRTEVAVVGTATADSGGVSLTNNGAPIGPLVPVTGGAFATTLSLPEGLNQLRAAAVNRGGTGPAGEPVKVTVDKGIPGAPIGLYAQSRESGQVHLTWNLSHDAKVTGYEVYRAGAPFTELAAAVRADPGAVAAGPFDDLPPADGTWYYRVVAVTAAGTRSALSNQASALADRIAPSAVAIDYAPAGPADPASGRIGVGRVEVRVALSEPVLTTPFLSIAPAGGLSKTVALTWADDTAYVGRFEVDAGTPPGTAYAVFSARDKAGNRGTGIGTGATLLLDTRGPTATGFAITPAGPIRNDPEHPVAVEVSFGLSETLAPGAAPSLTYQLPSTGPTPQALVTTADGSGRRHARLVLPAGAGRDGPEALTFAFQAADDLGNLGSEIQGPASVQVYQGELPPPGVPTGLSAVARPGGAVLLTWSAVAQASDYQLYRAAVGADETAPAPAPVALARSAGALTWTDQTPADGRYRYAVASVRSANGQEALSAQSAPVEVKADATAPETPTALRLAILPTGVQATWQAPGDADPLTYALYRVPGTGAGAPAADPPAQEGITEPSARDAAPPEPLGGHLAYAVAAVDPAGNRSPPTAWVAVNVNLLPVATLGVEQTGSDFPLLTWTHPSPVAGYDLYLGEGAKRMKVNRTPLADTEYRDLGWSGPERLYTLVAVDADAGESLGRGLRLPALTATRAAGATLKRGLMNRLDYQVANSGTAAAQGVVLELVAGGHTHRSAPFEVPAGGSAAAQVAVGGFADLPDQTELTVTLEQRPNPGERVRIVRREPIEVTDGVLPVELLTRDMTRGGAGQVRFALENVAALPVQILTATDRGAAASDEVRLSLRDADGNQLSTQAFKQTAGAWLKTLEDGRTVADVPPGGRFESDWLDLAVPASAPEKVQLVLDIDRIHYRLGQPDAVSIAGQGGRREVALVDTSYVGELTSVAPAHRFGPGTFRIAGRAVHRASGEPLARVPLNLVIAGDGFERVFEMVTGDDGGFAYDYAPLAGESGTYRVSVVHPDLLARPEQGSFSIGRVVVQPQRQTVAFARNRDREVTLKLTAGREFGVAQARLAYREEDQVFGGFEPGIAVTTGAPVDVAAEGSGTLGLTLRASDASRDAGAVVLRLLSDESPTSPLALVRLDFTLSAEGPALFPERSYLELSAAPGGRATGSIALENRGLAEATGVHAMLLDPATGQPPAWAFISSASAIGTLGVGERRPIDLTVAPGAAMSDDIYALVLRIGAENQPGFDIPVYVTLTRSGVGGVLFHAADIFTATLDADGWPIPGLAGARIEVQHEKIATLRQEATTDAQGEALFAGLPVGHYLFRASAPNHAAVTGRVSIQPGLTESREAFLEYGLISLEWEVTEIGIQDRYQVVLHLTYETDVPAPVVVIEPPGITLPEMAPGQVLRGEFTITNYGLVRADHVKFTPAQDDAWFDYEFMAEIPESIEAKGRITVPYRIVALQSLNPATGIGIGKSEGSRSRSRSCGYGSAARLIYDYLCANGVPSSGGTGFGVHANVTADCGEPVGCGCGPGTHCGGYIGGGGSGGITGGFPIIPCPPDCEGDCCDRYGAGGGGSSDGGSAGGTP